MKLRENGLTIILRIIFLFQNHIKTERGQIIMEKKDINYYMGLPYHTVIKEITDKSGKYFYAAIKEFDGCQSTGDSFQECSENIKEAMMGWIETKLEHGFLVPEPFED